MPGAGRALGTRTFVNVGAVLLDVARVTIGDDVQVGPNVQLLTATHPLDAETRRAGWEAAEPITIGDAVWLGGGVIVCPAVTIGPESVISRRHSQRRWTITSRVWLGSPSDEVATCGVEGHHSPPSASAGGALRPAASRSVGRTDTPGQPSSVCGHGNGVSRSRSATRRASSTFWRPRPRIRSS